MFDNLTDRIQETFHKLAGKGRLSEEDVKAALREVRLALLEADVNYRVVKEFIDHVTERAVGESVLKSLTPAQTVVKIVHEELIALLGEPARLDLGGKPPVVLMLVGLQGSGKTTMAAKLAVFLRKQGHRPLLVAADTYRPAAIQQLEILGREVNVPVHSEGQASPPQICRNAVARATREGYDVVLLDTAGRLQIDEAMMVELEQIRAQTNPREVLLVLDAMTGQEAVTVASEFHRRVTLTGILLTKVDGDARGGAALSVRFVTGVPIKFMGVGEKTGDLEPFYPDRLASRILGMGDVLTLIEKAEAAISREQAEALEKKLRTASFTFEDFYEQLKALRKMGPLNELLGMIPGMRQLGKEIPEDMTEHSLKKIEAIINSMTPQERRDPRIINASRKRRIARGSGTSVQDVNQLLRQFNEMQQLMKRMQGGRGMRFPMPRFR